MITAARDRDVVGAVTSIVLEPGKDWSPFIVPHEDRTTGIFGTGAEPKCSFVSPAAEVLPAIRMLMSSAAASSGAKMRRQCMARS